MPKKNMTPEERAAWGEKMKQAREKRKENLMNTVDAPSPEQDSGNVTLTAEQYEALMNRLAAIESKSVSEIPATPQSVQPEQKTPSIGSDGRPIGVIEKYVIDPAHYVDPCDELFQIFETKPQLRRFGLRNNYDLSWAVTPTKYQTAYGTWYIEPRFELIVYRRRFDEEGNERADKIIMGRDSFFEDPASNLLEAELAGLDYQSMSASEFAERMRMFRYERFVRETLNPPRRDQGKPATKKQEVIGGRAYEIEEGNSVVSL